MKLPARIVAMACKTALVIAIIPALLACSNDSSEPATATVSLSELQSQLGYNYDGATTLSSPTSDPADPATSVALSIALGAMAVDSRSLAAGPYTSRVPITDIETQLESDLRNSANFIILRNLPTAEDTVEIKIPEPGSKKYQIVAAALRTQPVTVDDLGEPAHQDSVIYIGFDPRFLTTSADGEIFELDSSGNQTGDALTTIDIDLIRACLVEPQDPPKGCAQYNSAAGAFVVSAAVEITGIYIDGSSISSLDTTDPYVVRSGGTAGACGGGTTSADECSPAIAASNLGALVPSGTTSVLVRTTHQAATNASTDCKNASTIADLEANCSVQDYYTPL